jgi:hypothetical protein
MDITYCNEKCPIGIAARDEFLELNNSAFDAAIDFGIFTENCFKTCPHRAAHDKQTKETL